MNTSAINSPANLLQTAPASGKQDAGANPDGASFDQLLSREMSSQDSTTPAVANPPANNNNGTKPAQKDASGKDDTTKSGETAGDTTKTDAKKSDDDKVASGKDVKKTDDKDDDKKVDAKDQSGIAAFVTALTNAKASPPDATAAASAAAAAARTAVTDADKETVSKKPSAVSVLDKVIDARGTKDADTAAKTVALTLATAKGAKATGMTGTEGNTQQTFAAAIASAVNQPATDAQSTTRFSELLPPVGTAGWDDALGQKVVWMVKGAEQTATLTLNPPDLGPMQVTVNVSNNQATANFVAHHPEVRQALEASMPRLRDMLNEAGIQLGQSSVNAGMPNQHGGFDQAPRGGSGRRGASTEGVVDASLHVSHVPTPLGGNGMVDTFV